MASWGKETERLTPKERSFVFAIGRLIAERQDPSAKQAAWARTLWERVAPEFHTVLTDYVRR